MQAAIAALGQMEAGRADKQSSPALRSPTPMFGWPSPGPCHRSGSTSPHWQPYASSAQTPTRMFAIGPRSASVRAKQRTQPQSRPYSPGPTIRTTTRGVRQSSVSPSAGTAARALVDRGSPNRWLVSSSKRRESTRADASGPTRWVDRAGSNPRNGQVASRCVRPSGGRRSRRGRCGHLRRARAQGSGSRGPRSCRGRPSGGG